MEITQEQKRKIFEELLIDEELHDEACDSDRQYWGCMSWGVRKVVKILGLYDEYKTYKENKQRGE